MGKDKILKRIQLYNGFFQIMESKNWWEERPYLILQCIEPL